MTRSLAFTLLLSTVASCAGHTSPAPNATPEVSVGAVPVAPSDAGTVSQASSGAAATSTSARNSSVITVAELDDPLVSNSDLYSTVQRLRPSFLIARGAVSLRGGGGSVLVSVDDGMLSSLATLRSLRTSEVKEIRYLAPNDAAQKFGTKASNGAVILVKRK